MIVDTYRNDPPEPADMWDALVMYRRGTLPDAADIPGRSLEEHRASLDLPEDPRAAIRKLRRERADARRRLARELAIWADVLNRGIVACTDYARNVYAGSNDELALGTTLSLTYAHIGWYRGQVEACDEEIRRLDVPEQQELSL